MRFKVYFHFKGKCRHVLVPRTLHVLNGFWLNRDKEFSFANTPYSSSHAYFIPSHQIRMIEDLNVTGSKA